MMGCSMLFVVDSTWVPRMVLVMMSIVVFSQCVVSRQGLVKRSAMVLASHMRSIELAVVIIILPIVVVRSDMMTSVFLLEVGHFMRVTDCIAAWLLTFLRSSLVA